MEQFRFKGEFAVVPTDIINNPRWYEQHIYEYVRHVT
jgi:hypothetical protein